MKKKCDWQWEFGNYLLKVLTSQFSELEVLGWGVGKRVGGEEGTEGDWGGHEGGIRGTGRRAEADRSRPSECMSERPRGFSAADRAIICGEITVLTHPKSDRHGIFWSISSYWLYTVNSEMIPVTISLTIYSLETTNTASFLLKKSWLAILSVLFCKALYSYP